MKVCKVVVNSVAHDARVLKEAEALRQAEFNVVVVGIQDGANSAPIETLDDGVVIRRAAWQSTAYEPPAWVYAISLSVLIAICGVVVWLVFWFERNIAAFGALLNFETAVLVTALLVVGYFAIVLALDYLKRRKTYDSLRKHEEGELLKYEDELSAHRSDTRKPPATVSPAKRYEDKAPPLNLLRLVPRPLMGGPIRAFLPVNLRRWRAIFARERMIYRLLVEERPEIVHAHDLSALPVAVKYARKHKIKLVFDAHEVYDHLAQSEEDMSALNAKILRKYSGDVDLFVTINDSIARYYRRTYALLPRAIVIKNAAKPAGAFSYDGRLHEVAGLSPETRILLYQGGFSPKRGLSQLLLSARYLDPRWSLVFMGWGRLEEELRRVADSLKMSDPELDQRIRFIPRVKQTGLPFWTAGASLGAIPYENTGLNHWYCNPNKLWEYPNAGVPVLASPFPELRKTVETHQIGWLLPDPLSPREIAARVNRITDQELATASRNCGEFMRKDNWDVYARRLQTAYAGLR